MNQLLNNLTDYLGNNDLPLLPIGVVLFAIGLALALAMPPAEPAPTAQDAIYIIATPTAVPQAAPTAPTLPRAVVAYAAPGGVTLGAIEAGRAYAQLARSGAEWVLLDVAGSGRVWVQSAELAGVVAGLPDMATPVPTPAPQVVIVERPAPVQAPPQIVHHSELPQWPDLTEAEQAATMRLQEQAHALQQQLQEQQQAVPTPAPADGWGSLGGGSGGSWGD